MLFTYLLYLHVLAGSLSLILFWMPTLTKKGGKTHRKAGSYYIISMWVVVGSAAVLSFHNAYNGETNTALFLGFLSILSAQPLYHGIAVLNNKKSFSDRFKTVSIAMNIALLLSGAFLIVYATVWVDEGVRILMYFFGVIGLTALGNLRQLFRKPQNKAWFQEHYKGMITSGIAAYTAFFAFGGRRFLEDILPGMWQILPWILPTLLGVVAMRLYDRYYRKKGIIPATS